MGRQVKTTSAGDLRIRMRIFTQQESDDGQGGIARTPLEVDTSWGDAQMLSPQRQEQSAQVQQRVTHRIRFRYAQRMLQIKDEVHYRDMQGVQHIVSVKTVLDVDLRGKVIVVEGEEVQPMNHNNPDAA